MPSRVEIQSLTHLGRVNPTIDLDYFPDAGSALYRTAASNAADPRYAWSVAQGSGEDNRPTRNITLRFRLVRDKK
ncbi:MAG: DUF1566 domain-containing protein [Wenzhouxiangella sp.]|nr:MAG: DUF1566 domain-containing protein [Wenzhouxiangella sp.]